MPKRKLENKGKKDETYFKVKPTLNSWVVKQNYIPRHNKEHIGVL